MKAWHAYAGAAALLYGLHQVFTKLAARDAGAALGGLIVEGTAAVVIAGYIATSLVAGSFSETVNARGWMYCVLTGICVGLGTVFFFELFRRGAPLSAVPTILAAGSALMAVIGMTVLGEPPHLLRVVGVASSIVAIVCLGRS